MVILMEDLLTNSMTDCILVHQQIAIQVPIHRDILNAIEAQTALGIEFKLRDPFNQLQEVFRSSLDRRFVAPTDAQLAYAEAISTKLGVVLTDEQRYSKASCGKFLDKYATKFKKIIQEEREGGS